MAEEKTKQFHLKNKGAFDERNSKVPRGKRQFDRHSGTGRGKEIAKNGAGGKFTWGTNPKNIAKKGDEEYHIIVSGVKDTGLCGKYWTDLESLPSKRKRASAGQVI